MILKKFPFPIYYLLLPLLFLYTSCKKELKEDLEFPKNSKYKQQVALAETYFENQNYDSAFYYYNKIKTTSDTNQGPNKIIYALLKMATIEQLKGDYSSSETTATEALSYLQTEKNQSYHCYLYNLLGINYENLYAYKEAVFYYKKAFQMATDPIQKAVLKNNIATVNLEQGNYMDAIAALDSLSGQKTVQQNKENYARVLDNLGYSYFKIENPRAATYLNHALEIRTELQEDYGLTKSYLHLSEYFADKNPTKSNTYAKIAYDKATKTNNVEGRLKSLSLMIQNNPKSSFRIASKNYFRINDSLNQARQKAKNQFAKIKYDAAKERDENLKLKAQNSATELKLVRQKNQKYIALIALLVLTTAIVFLVTYFRTKNKLTKIEAMYDTETRISKKLHDELANDVYQTMLFTTNLDWKDRTEKETLLQNLDQIYLRTRNISKENSTIPTDEGYETNLKEMLNSYGTQNIKVILKYNGDIDWLQLTAIKKIALYRTLQELMVNMRKHSKCTFAVIGFENQQNTLLISYTDNGIGFTKTLNLKNGLSNVENRIDAIKGTITFASETNKSFRVTITIPK
ncbi:hypothetical protein LPBF_05790 [Flavobacterium crassostreae]|uniref:histidine kinase n=1 Tax=Flavobacterium crassostreae TaxID=1763534 RepID=A0A1B9E3E3_9FLAO|nr:hypothetical protein LPBF_05790 [Flavobacterium crassostreae]